MKFLFFVLVALSCVFIGCNESPKSDVAVATSNADSLISKKESIGIDSTLTRMSRLIAGMDTLVNYKHPDWNISAIKRFCLDTDLKYQQMRSSRLEKLSTWHATNLKNASIDDTSFVFYPFSGGDFIHLRWLFPNATNYLMAAREEVGTYPDITSMDSTDVMEYLKGVDIVLRDIYNKSYFITKNMITDIHNQNLVDGMLPILIWGAAKTDLEIVSINFFNIDTLGNIDSSQQNKYMGVVMNMKDPKANCRKSLTYLSCDISDKGFTLTPGVEKYIENIVPSGCNSFVKSASYLLHYSSFGHIRNIILDKSKCLLQDDTGIPFKYFDKSLWNVNLYGVYDIPVSDFSENLFQNDMNQAYKDSTYYKGPIDFSLGYHWGSGNQNQMFSYKKSMNK